MGAHAAGETPLERMDTQASSQGWFMYIVGWCLCCCCGPVGPILWFAVAGVFLCRPSWQRDHLRRERSVAMVSLTTGVIVTIMFFMAAVSYMEMGEKRARCEPPRQWHHNGCYTGPPIDD